MDLNLVQIVFDVETDNAAVQAAYYYQALRRFDLLFRQACCRCGGTQCSACKEQTACPYREVFAQELSTDPDIVRRHQKPPLPFAFKIRQIPDNNSCFEISLVVVGNAVNHLAVFNSAVRRLIESTAQQCPGAVPVITGIYCLDYQSLRHELDCSFRSTGNLVILSSLEIMENTVEAENIRLILDSPLRLLSAGAVLYDFEFTVFLRSQLRRCSSLFAYYGDGELELDFAGLSAAADHVKCLKNGIRYLQPSWSQRSNHAGLQGISEFGDLAPGMRPLLALGSYLNAGKGASFGLGAYRAEAA
ncbi:MAG: CRISPR system precrRNA processing endoribonuclease RAMP protein Cas6 [Steroidobacteraceae bacterium]|nr:CRISPR system precrRNA processing endoribonuclease RAMP protein Cas6 [Deltaproteobacteria bacterium]